MHDVAFQRLASSPPASFPIYTHSFLAQPLEVQSAAAVNLVHYFPTCSGGLSEGMTISELVLSLQGMPSLLPPSLFFTSQCLTLAGLEGCLVLNVNHGLNTSAQGVQVLEVQHSDNIWCKVTDPEGEGLLSYESANAEDQDGSTSTIGT